MKKTSHIITACLLSVCFLFFEKALSGSPLGIPLTSDYSPSASANFPYYIKHSPFHYLFFFEPFDHQVCRKPVFLFYTPSSQSFGNLHYNSVFFKTTSLGPNYFRVDGNITFRKGNTFLLVPHSFILPVNSGLEDLPGPTMTLPRAD